MLNIMLNTPQNKTLQASKMGGNFQLSVAQLTICKLDISSERSHKNLLI